MALRILLIDDDPVDRQAIRHHLLRNERAIKFTEVGSGAEAIALLMQSQPFDCIFLDYNLRDMTAVDILDSVRDAQTGLAPAPVVVLTGQVREAAMIDVLACGAQDYLIKNIISSDMLAVAITKAIGAFGLKQTQLRTEARLRQAEKMEAVGRLTSGVAHDFNNLLGIIIGNVQQMRAGLPMADAERALAAIEAAGERGASLVRRLMVFTRQRAAECQTIDIAVSLQELGVLLTSTLGAEIIIDMRLSPHLWPVRVDPGQLENALINLAINARDAMPGGGRLTIAAENIAITCDSDLPPGDYVRLSVADTGHGIPPAIRARIFEPFFTTKDAGAGTGLGLAMVYGFIEQAGGRIRVESNDGGTTFTIDLPCWTGRDVAPATSSAQSTAPPPLLRKTILLVEDNPALGEMTEMLLARLGYDVVRANDGHDALEILQTRHTEIDLLFTDIIMPGGLDGIETARRACALYPGLRLLYTSGNADLALADRLDSGATFIAKPYRKEHLTETIASLLGRGAG